MEAFELKKGFYFTGAIDHDLRVFDIIMYTEFGTTYNSYVLKTGKHTVLFETAKAKCCEDWLKKVGEITPIEEVDYLVVSHTEPDHSGSIERLLDLNPRLKIVATGCALGFLKEIVNKDFYSIAVKDGQTLELDGKTLEFIVVPNLHWPDTMYTYIREDKTLVTCDSFGSHYAMDEVVASKVTDREGYLRATKYYFDCIIGPYKSFMLSALRRVRQLELDMICPGHGPVLDCNIPWMLDTYEEWSTVINPNPRTTVIIPYVSAYGYTGRLAQAIAQGIRESGDIDVRTYDMVEADAARVAEELLYADGFLLGTPTIVGEALKPIWDLTTGMFATTHGGKLAGAFGSYGWSGEGVPHIMERLKQLKMKTVEPFRVRFKPSEGQLEQAREFGRNFGQTLLENRKSVRRAPARKVKCKVCGAVFDEGAEVCPVCKVGPEHFAPLDKETTPAAPKAGEKVRCKICGAVFDGSKERCPVCGVGPEYYVKLDEQKAAAPKGGRRLVKCLVCGEIFDASLDTCPVCGVGRDKFVEVEEEKTAFHNDTRNSYVILGNGCAGVSAAEAIRERDKTGRILLISNEGPAYQRPMLTKAMLSGLTEEQMALHPAGWYEANNIVQILNRQVISVDTEKKTVTLDGGSALPYTKLIFALGSECFIPPIPGHDQAGVVAIRRIGDVEKIQAMGAALKRAVVIGGGVLGLEAAWELRKARCEVTVLELAPQLMGRQLDDAAAQLLLKQCGKAGVRVETGVQIAAIEGDGKVAGVKLGTGEVIPADLVVMSCGVRANTAIAKAAGVETDRAIVVSENMETNLPGVYACGDCAQFNGVNFALWPEAQEQGKVAGACATGDLAVYKTISPILAFHGMDTELFSLGDPGKAPGVAYQTVEIRDEVQGRLERYYFTGGRLCGVILVGDLSKMADMIKAVEEKRPLDKFFA